MSEFSNANVRVADRLAVDCPAYLRQPRSIDRPVMLRNVSSAGFKCHFPYPIEEQAEVTLIIPGVGVFPATVCWKLGIAIGGSFHQELGWRQLGEVKAAARRLSRI
jgi:hypothetical protein